MSLLKPWDQPHPPRGRNPPKENYSPTACGLSQTTSRPSPAQRPARPQTLPPVSLLYPQDQPHLPPGRHQPQEHLSPAACGQGPSTSRTAPDLGPAGPKPWPPAGQHKLWDTPDTAVSCVRNQHHPPPTLGLLCSAARPQDPALPASGPALVLGHSFIYQCAGTRCRNSWNPPLATREPALAPGPAGFYSQPPCDLASPSSSQKSLHKAGISNELDRGQPSLPDNPQ